MNDREKKSVKTEQIQIGGLVRERILALETKIVQKIYIQIAMEMIMIQKQIDV